MFDKDMVDVDEIRAQEIVLGNPAWHDHGHGAFSNSPLRASGVLKEIRKLVPLEEGKDDNKAN